MKNINFQIDLEDLQALYMHSRQAYGNMSFENWTSECKKAYVEYLNNRENPKTYSEWVNAQIIALAY
jgi:hypothetical protein